MSTSGEKKKKTTEFKQPRVKKRGEQPESLSRGQKNTNIPGAKRGPYIFEIPEETEDYAKLVRAMMELQNEYTKYKKTHQYESYRKSRTWLRTIKLLANEIHSDLRVDYIEYTNKNLDDD